MKRLIIILVAIVLMGSSLAEDIYVLCRPGDIVNARLSPSTRAQVVGWLTCGDRLTTDGIEKGGFVHIIDCSMETDEAWVSKRYIVEDEPMIMNIRVIIIAEGRVAARKWVDGPRRTWMRPGTEVTLLARADEWSITNRGFVRTEFLGVN